MVFGIAAIKKDDVIVDGALISFINDVILPALQDNKEDNVLAAKAEIEHFISSHPAPF